MIDHLLQIRVLQIRVLQIRVLQIRVLQICVLQIRVLQIRVLQIRVLQIQSVFYKSNPVRILQYADLKLPNEYCFNCFINGEENRMRIKANLPNFATSLSECIEQT